MDALTKSCALFMLNWLDAQLTIFWVRFGFATEGNSLMARLLDAGNFPFLSTKLFVGAFAAYVLYRWSHLTLARRGTRLALTVYLGLMIVHLATGLNALGSDVPQIVMNIIYLPDGVLALFL